MFAPQATAFLRTVLDEVCDGISCYETGVRAYVASQILEAARRGGFTVDEFRQAGSKALSGAPTM